MCGHLQLNYDTDISLAQIWVVSGAGEQLNTIEAGWITHSGRNQTRMFLYWMVSSFISWPLFVDHLDYNADRPVGNDYSRE
ncbi:putative neprosin [Rosa chinensis]|uniref:Putative neprosin n=1 Tax=Rosa chinensis TaxID=74649 RepID=A0A2P6RXP9_ROSCH|nr:putative neprosin [Rosa chinensis]